jgi:hypothetical protein
MRMFPITLIFYLLISISFVYGQNSTRKINHPISVKDTVGLPQKALYIMNDSIAGYNKADAFKKLKLAEIKSIEVLSPVRASAYGKLGKNGVVLLRSV